MDRNLKEDVPVFLGLLLGDSHTLAGHVEDVFLGADVHLERHDAERFEGARAALLYALETALRTADLCR